MREGGMGQGNFPLPLDFQVSHQYLTDIYSFFKLQSFLKKSTDTRPKKKWEEERKEEGRTEEK